jgi:hypothetical protein
MLGSIPPLPNTPSCNGAQLKKREAQGQLYLYLYLVTNLVIRIFLLHYLNNKSRDSSVGTAPGYGLDDRGSRVRFPEGAGNFSLHHRVQKRSGAHPAS